MYTKKLTLIAVQDKEKNEYSYCYKFNGNLMLPFLACDKETYDNILLDPHYPIEPDDFERYKPRQGNCFQVLLDRKYREYLDDNDIHVERPVRMSKRLQYLEKKLPDKFIAFLLLGDPKNWTLRGEGTYSKVYDLNNELNDMVVKKYNQWDLFLLTGSEEYEIEMRYNRDQIQYWSRDRQGNVYTIGKTWSTNLYLKLYSGIKLKMKAKLRLALTLAQDLEYIHDELKTVHGNLKTINILLNTRGKSIVESRIIGFAHSYIGDRKTVLIKHNNHNLGSIAWYAPEQLGEKQMHFSKKSDVYAFGMLMFTILKQIQPFAEVRSDGVLISVVRSGEIQELDMGTRHKPWEDLIKDCWNLDPRDRPDATTVKSRLQQLLCNYEYFNKDSNNDLVVDK